MKKALAVALTIIVLLVGVVSIAEIDLSGMSLEELITLREQIDEAIMATDNYIVVVPGGMYMVGSDIPAGRWVISSHDKERLATVELGTPKDDGSFSWIRIDIPRGEEYVLPITDGQSINLDRSLDFMPYTTAFLGFGTQG